VTDDSASDDADLDTGTDPTRPATGAGTVVVCCDGSADDAPPRSMPGDTGDSPCGDSGATDTGADIEGEADDTTSTQMRHWLTNDLLAGFLHLTLVAVVLAAGFGYLDLSAIPARMRLVFLGTVLSATVWSFGEDVLQSIRGS
jgi:hypothetical protein